MAFSEDYIDFLIIHRKNKVHELIKSVAVDKELIPKNGLPIWTKMSLDEKLPIPPFMPTSLINFSRGKIGKKLWKSIPGQDFNLDDPNMYEVDFTYEPLHDPHLRNFFRNPVIRNRAIELKLIDNKGRAISTLKGFNRFRRYHSRVHANLVNQERIKQDLIDKNKRIMDRIVKGEGLYSHDWKIRSEKAKKRVIDRLYAFKAKTLNQVREKKKKVSKFLEERQEKWDTALVCARMRDQTIRDQIAMKKHLQRAKLMSTLEKLYQDALERDLNKVEKTYEKLRLKEIKKQEYWARKVKMQENYLNRETNLSNILEVKTSKHIKKRQNKWNLELIKMKTQLEEIKYIMAHPKLRIELEEKKAKLAAALQLKKKEDKKKLKDKEEDIGSEDSKEMKFSKNVPQPVQVAIIHLLSSVLHNYVLKLLIKSIKELPHIIIETQIKLVHQYYNQINKPFRWVCGKTGKKWPKCKHVCITEKDDAEEEQVMMQMTKESNSMTTIESSEQKRAAIQAKIAHYDMERRKLKVNGGSIHSTQTLNKTKARANTSTVSFGIHSLIGRRDVTDPAQLRDCKKRIPTPVPSMLQIVESLAVEGEDNDDDDMVMFDDMRIPINSEIKKFRRWVGNQILIRAKKAIDENSRIMYKNELRDVTSHDVLDKLAHRFLVSTCAVIIETKQADQLCDVLVRELFMKLNEMRTENLKKRQELSNKKNSSTLTFQFMDSEDEIEEAEVVVPAKQVRIKFFDEESEALSEKETKGVAESKAQAIKKTELFQALFKMNAPKEGKEEEEDQEDEEEEGQEDEEEEETDKNESDYI